VSCKQNEAHEIMHWEAFRRFQAERIAAGADAYIRQIDSPAHNDIMVLFYERKRTFEQYKFIY
jgi:hypothetical protein